MINAESANIDWAGLELDLVSKALVAMAIDLDTGEPQINGAGEIVMVKFELNDKDFVIFKGLLELQNGPFSGMNMFRDAMISKTISKYCMGRIRDPDQGRLYVAGDWLEADADAIIRGDY